MGKTAVKFHQDRLETKETKAPKEYVEKRNRKFEERQGQRLKCLRNVDMKQLDLFSADEDDEEGNLTEK